MVQPRSKQLNDHKLHYFKVPIDLSGFQSEVSAASGSTLYNAIVNNCQSGSKSGRINDQPASIKSTKVGPYGTVNNGDQFAIKLTIGGSTTTWTITLNSADFFVNGGVTSIRETTLASRITSVTSPGVEAKTEDGKLVIYSSQVGSGVTLRVEDVTAGILNTLGLSTTTYTEVSGTDKADGVLVNEHYTAILKAGDGTQLISYPTFMVSVKNLGINIPKCIPGRPIGGRVSYDASSDTFTTKFVTGSSPIYVDIIDSDPSNIVTPVTVTIHYIDESNTLYDGPVWHDLEYTISSGVTSLSGYVDAINSEIGSEKCSVFASNIFSDNVLSPEDTITIKNHYDGTETTWTVTPLTTAYGPDQIVNELNARFGAAPFHASKDENTIIISRTDAATYEDSIINISGAEGIGIKSGIYTGWRPAQLVGSVIRIRVPVISYSVKSAISISTSGTTTGIGTLNVVSDEEESIELSTSVLDTISNNSTSYMYIPERVEFGFVDSDANSIEISELSSDPVSTSSDSTGNAVILGPFGSIKNENLLPVYDRMNVRSLYHVVHNNPSNYIPYNIYNYSGTVSYIERIGEYGRSDTPVYSRYSGAGTASYLDASGYNVYYDKVSGNYIQHDANYGIIWKTENINVAGGGVSYDMYMSDSASSSVGSASHVLSVSATDIGPDRKLEMKNQMYLSSDGTMQFNDANIGKIPLSGSSSSGDDKLRAGPIPDMTSVDSTYSIVRSLNARAQVTCGDGTNTFGDFNGSDAIADALNEIGVAQVSLFIKSGSYTHGSSYTIYKKHIIGDGKYQSIINDNVTVHYSMIENIEFDQDVTVSNNSKFINCYFYGSAVEVLHTNVEFINCEFYISKITVNGSVDEVKFTNCKFDNNYNYNSPILIIEHSDSATDSDGRVIFDNCVMNIGVSEIDSSTHLFTTNNSIIGNTIESGASSTSFKFHSIDFNNCKLLATNTITNQQSNTIFFVNGKDGSNIMKIDRISLKGCEITTNMSNSSNRASSIAFDENVGTLDINDCNFIMDNDYYYNYGSFATKDKVHGNIDSSAYSSFNAPDSEITINSTNTSITNTDFYGFMKSGTYNDIQVYSDNTIINNVMITGYSYANHGSVINNRIYVHSNDNVSISNVIYKSYGNVSTDSWGLTILKIRQSSSKCSVKNFITNGLSIDDTTSPSYGTLMWAVNDYDSMISISDIKINSTKYYPTLTNPVDFPSESISIDNGKSISIYNCYLVSMFNTVLITMSSTTKYDSIININNNKLENTESGSISGLFFSAVLIDAEDVADTNSSNVSINISNNQLSNTDNTKKAYVVYIKLKNQIHVNTSFNSLSVIGNSTEWYNTGSYSRAIHVTYDNSGTETSVFSPSSNYYRYTGLNTGFVTTSPAVPEYAKDGESIHNTRLYLSNTTP